jgi:hypothetical protein
MAEAELARGWEHVTTGSEKTALPPRKAGNVKVTTVETSSGDDRKKGEMSGFQSFRLRGKPPATEV